jgi:hypothetical protein
MLGQHIVANTIHEGAQLLRARKSLPVPQDIENAEEGLLSDVFNGLRGSESPAELDEE